jgi:hypothetical protein
VAAKRGNIEIFEALLNFGADLNVTDLLNRNVGELMQKYLKDDDERKKLRTLLRMKENGELVNDSYKYRSKVYLESLKKQDLKKKFNKMIE